jgi:transcription antitermination factor NusG
MHNLAYAYPMTNPDLRWFVLTVEPTRDGHAKRLLSGQGFEVVSLKVYVGWVSRRCLKDTIELMLPGYLLIRLDPESAPWLPILQTKYVTGVLRNDGRPVPLPVEAAEKLMGRMDCTGLVNPHEVRKRPPMLAYEVGQALRITDGPFVGYTASFRQRAGDRIVAFLRLLGGEVEAIIPEIHIEPVGRRVT